ncbi:MAG TPA: peptidoglycan-binding domain-containing protein [Acidimicrobiia bacterium]|nr:peptidoglycan-binding domain-containing protein [Acidimicrobiia bacterium]
MRKISRPVVALVTLMLIATACGGGTAATTTTTTPSTTTTSTIPPTTTTTEPPTTTTTLPPSPVLAVEGDVNEVVAQIQWLVTCGGFGNIVIDGEFDDITAEAVMSAQESLGFTPDAAPTEDFFIAATRLCLLDRPLEIGPDPVRVFGFAAPDEPETYTFEASAGVPVTVEVLSGSGVLVTVSGPEGAALVPDEDEIITIQDDGTHRLVVSTGADGVFFTIGMIFEFSGEAGDWIITTDGIAYRDTEFVKGDAADAMIEEIYEILGHEPRSQYGEFDTGWEEPGQEGFRGVFIEGLAFLFIGPNAENPTRPKTFWRVRYVGESYDANGLPRPYGWVQTLSGITVGDTLDDLIETYGSQVSAGSNSEEHYYRFGASDGSEVCFYFGPDEPDSDDPVLEISTECRD